MPGQICPIFERSERDHERIDLIGAWFQFPQNLRIITDDGFLFGELGHIGPMAAAFFRKEKHRQVPNTRTDVGNGCEFQDGAFVMGVQHAAPNEPNGAPGKEFLYEMKNNGGTIILIRSRNASAKPKLTREQEAKLWFTEATARGGPCTPKDFDLFELPNHPLTEWAKRVSSDPWSPRSCIMRIADMGDISSTLYTRFSEDHGIASSDAVDLFDTYLGAACPKCFGGLNGSVLQQVGVARSAASYIGGGDGFQRILNGTCATCESETYHVIWHGDLNGPRGSGEHNDPGTPTATAKLPLEMWTEKREVPASSILSPPKKREAKIDTMQDRGPHPAAGGRTEGDAFSSTLLWIIGIVVVVIVLFML